MDKTLFPRIETVFRFPVDSAIQSYYELAIRNCLFKILPSTFFHFNGKYPQESLQSRFESIVPQIKSVPSLYEEENISFYMLAKYRHNAFKFFSEMFSKWIVPGNRSDTLLLFAADFKIPEFGDQVYTISELIVNIKDLKKTPEVLENISKIEIEAKLGLESAFHARRVLEIRGYSVDDKTAMVQEYVSKLVKRSPKFFSRDLFTEMQHVLVTCSDQFKNERNSKLLCKIITSHYYFRKQLANQMMKLPQRRHINVRVFRSKIKKEGEEKQVLCVLVGVNFLRTKEIFEEQHLITAILNYLPNVQTIKDSFFSNKRGLDQLCMVYLEIEKKEGEEFTRQEINLLKNELVIDLKDRIGHLTHPVFMPRNEEEIMRNVLSLSNQIKYIRDLPQVFISFDEQKDSFLYFNVIIVRVVIPGSLSIQEMFEKRSGLLEYIPDRCKMLGMLRKQYTKEATIFRFKMKSSQFLRPDHSIDLYKARKLVVDELKEVCGEFRDYNGGMISKQSELLGNIQNLLSIENIKYNELLLENFFYSIHPVITRSILEPQSLKQLFQMMLKIVNTSFIDKKNYVVDIKKEKHFVYVMIATHDELIKKELAKNIRKMPKETTSFASFYLVAYEIPYLGYIYKTDDKGIQEQFCSLIYQTLESFNGVNKAI